MFQSLALESTSKIYQYIYILSYIWLFDGAFAIYAYTYAITKKENYGVIRVNLTLTQPY